MSGCHTDARDASSWWMAIVPPAWGNVLHQIFDHQVKYRHPRNWIYLTQFFRGKNVRFGTVDSRSSALYFKSSKRIFNIHYCSEDEERPADCLDTQSLVHQRPYMPSPTVFCLSTSLPLLLNRNRAISNIISVIKFKKATLKNATLRDVVRKINVNRVRCDRGSMIYTKEFRIHAFIINQ